MKGKQKNIMGKEENCRLPAFTSFPTMSSKKTFLRLLIKSENGVIQS